MTKKVDNGIIRDMTADEQSEYDNRIADWNSKSADRKLAEIKQIRNNLDKITDWKNINELIPKFYSKNEMKKTGIAGIFAASLELTKEGIVKVSQSKLFEKLMIKRT